MNGCCHLTWLSNRWWGWVTQPRRRRAELPEWSAPLWSTGCPLQREGDEILIKKQQKGLMRGIGTMFLPLNVQQSSIISVITCRFDMLWVIRVCRLPIDVSSSKLKPDKESRVSIILTNILLFFKLLCVVHSHIDSVWLQRSIAEMISVVLLHAVITVSDHVCSCCVVTELHRGPLVSRHTQTTSDLCGWV